MIVCPDCGLMMTDVRIGDADADGWQHLLCWGCDYRFGVQHASRGILDLGLGQNGTS